ncbi:MAG TPA: XdhC family protein, partial [Pyrinomonadaceae bacterium]|nr:XdhC family protein [Pyrinomonadaceae bacterium]
MKKELEIWRFIYARLKRNENVMLMVVAESAGSSPGRNGFKMAIAGDEMCGSIGGGVMEVNLVELAGKLSKDKRQKAESKIKTNNSNDSAVLNQSAIVEQVHRKNAQNSSGMICSGRQTVIFFALNRQQHLKTVKAIVGALKNRQSKILRISNSEFEIAESGAGDFDFRFEQKAESEFLFEEKLGFKNRLFIVGGGHCALALSEIAAKMDFHIALFDDRPFLNTLATNKFVHEKKIIESYERIGEFIPSGAADVYVVVMTLGYKSDAVVIRRLFDRDFKYFGVLGSRAKMATLLKNLRREGFSEEKLDRICTPVGLPINSRTPE